MFPLWQRNTRWGLCDCYNLPKSRVLSLALFREEIMEENLKPCAVCGEMIDVDCEPHEVLGDECAFIQFIYHPTCYFDMVHYNGTLGQHYLH